MARRKVAEHTSYHTKQYSSTKHIPGIDYSSSCSSPYKLEKKNRSQTFCGRLLARYFTGRHDFRWDSRLPPFVHVFVFIHSAVRQDVYTTATNQQLQQSESGREGKPTEKRIILQ